MVRKIEVISNSNTKIMTHGNTW